MKERIIRWMDAAGFAALAGAMMHLLLHYSPYVARFHDMSLFNSGWDWFAGHFDRPGALLLYAGRFLTQFCLYPLAAVLILLVILAAITFLIRKFLVKDSRYGAFAALPALMLFLFITGMGYEVITARADAQIFTQPLGILSSLLMLAPMQALSSRKAAALVPLAAVILFFPLFGTYALLSAVTFASWSIFHTEGKRRILLPVIAILAAAIVPWLYSISIYDHTVPEYIWFVGAPYLDYEGYTVQFVKLGAAGALLPLFALPRLRSPRPAGWAHVALGTVVFSITVTSVYILPERRALFHRQMEAERAISTGNWNRVLSVTATQGITDDVLVAYRNCALYALGRLPQDCWKYSFNTIPINSGKTVYPSSRIAGPSIFYHSGLINFAARWASEISLYGNYSIERIQYLAKAALINGEYDLARKYISTIGKTTLDKGWARKYMAYADNPGLMAEDAEFKRLIPLQDYEEKGWYPSDVAAYDVLLFYSFVKGCSKEMLEWNLAAALLTKSGQYFEEIYPEYASGKESIPPEVESARSFFKTLIFNDKDASDPGNYLHFYYNETILRPN